MPLALMSMLALILGCFWIAFGIALKVKSSHEAKRAGSCKTTPVGRIFCWLLGLLPPQVSWGEVNIARPSWHTNNHEWRSWEVKEPFHLQKAQVSPIGLNIAGTVSFWQCLMLATGFPNVQVKLCQCQQPYLSSSDTF